MAQLGILTTERGVVVTDGVVALRRRFAHRRMSTGSRCAEPPPVTPQSQVGRRRQRATRATGSLAGPGISSVIESPRPSVASPLAGGTGHVVTVVLMVRTIRQARPTGGP